MVVELSDVMGAVVADAGIREGAVLCGTEVEAMKQYS